MVTVVTIYFYITLHDLMLVNFGLNWLKCDTFSIIQALMLWFIRLHPTLVSFNVMVVSPAYDLRFAILKDIPIAKQSDSLLMLWMLGKILYKWE